MYAGGGVKKVSHLVRGGGGSQKFHTWSGGVTEVSPPFGGGGQTSFWASNVDLTGPSPPYINNEHSLTT